ncbi:coiled-coil domain-containing protein 30 isoform X2 [Antechinus flavipes]|uniref:coiled-coil domain-containing protein 30 isoform X2 n=1 Tax=Antechinus flavipes TaxID=38775 RepID=UPI002235D553|nr:coiled-coil domain-containing protein 30 isoform X2 [Antechinus flavipes]
MLWVAVYFPSHIPSVIWNSVSVTLHYHGDAVLGKLGTKMEKQMLENVRLEDILHFLEREGIDSLASTEDQLCYVWRLFQHSENRLRTASGDLEELRVKHMEEMKEVENYVNHVRQLTEEREALTHDFEKESERLQLEFKELQLQQEIELKEIEEMLDQEGLSEIAQSSPSEQIAYLLVERTTLLEKLELADPKLNSYNLVGNGLQGVHLKDEFEQIHTLEDEFQKQQEFLHWPKETLNKPPNEELEKEKNIQGKLKSNVEEEADRRLREAHEEICRLTEKLDAKEKEHNKLELALSSAQLEIKVLKENFNTLKENELTDLQEAKQHNHKLDRNILALRNHVQKDSEIKMCVELDKKKEIVSEDNHEAERSEKSDEIFHKRCKKMIEDQKFKFTDLLHKFQKLEHEHEHLVERNEELELLLGETQNQTKEERKHFEYHVEKLQRKISSLETELSKIQESKRETVMKSQDTVTKAEDFQEILIMNQEEIEVLESQLSEEKAWRKELAFELKKAQKVLQADSQELERSKSELLYLFNEIQNLQGKREDKHFFFTAYEILQRENAFLETKSSIDKRLRYQHQGEEMQKLQQNLQRVQTLCSSAERELQFERTKSFDLKQHNNLLQEENIKIKAELKQAQKKLLDSTKMCSSITANWESSQQKVRDLEQEILKQSKNIQSQNSLYEKLAQEKTRVAHAEKMVLELQKKLEVANESCTEACILDKKQLEEAIKEARKNETKLKMQYQEEQQKRKLLDQSIDELQQHIQYLHAKEALMEQSNSKQQFKIQQQEVQLQILEDEKKLSDEQVKNNQELTEKISVLQQEKDSLREEYRQFLNQLDVHMRNYNEKHNHHKAKLRKAKERLTNEVEQRDERIKQLENEIEEMQRLMEKEKEFQDQVTTQNENLLIEKRRLLERLTEQDETIQGNKWMISSVQNRVLFLDEENKLLQENSLRLTQQVGFLEQILKTIQLRRGEETTISELSENELLNKKFTFPNSSFPVTGMTKSLENLKMTEEQNSEELVGSTKSSLYFSQSHPNMSSLNVAALVGKLSSHDQDQSQKDGPNDI